MTLTPRTFRTARLAAAAAALGGTMALVSACGTGQSPAASGSSSHPAHHAASQTGDAAQTGATTTAASTVPRCTTQGLHVVELATERGHGAYYTGVAYYNTTKHACTLDGYPKVSFAQGSPAKQVGRPAAKLSTPPPTLVTIQPGKYANDTVVFYANRVTSSPNCDPAPASWLRIYPPGQTTAVLIPTKKTVCSGTEIDLAVSAVS